MKKFLFYSLLICFLINCSSSDEDIVEETLVLPTKTIEKAFPDYDFVKLYQYDKNKLKSVIWTGGFRFDYFYTGNLITKINCIDNTGSLYYSTRFEYENGKMKKLINRNTFDDEDLIFTYTWIAENQVRIQNNRQLPENVTTRYFDIFLSNGNVSKSILHLEKPELIIESTIEYEYDNKNYPFKNIEGYSNIITSDDLNLSPIGIVPQVNNLIKTIGYYKEIKNGQTNNSPISYIDLSDKHIYKENGFPSTSLDRMNNPIQIEYNK